MALTENIFTVQVMLFVYASKFDEILIHLSSNFDPRYATRFNVAFFNFFFVILTCHSETWHGTVSCCSYLMVELDHVFWRDIITNCFFFYYLLYNGTRNIFFVTEEFTNLHKRDAKNAQKINFENRTN